MSESQFTSGYGDPIPLDLGDPEGHDLIDLLMCLTGPDGTPYRDILTAPLDNDLPAVGSDGSPVGGAR